MTARQKILVLTPLAVLLLAGTWTLHSALFLLHAMDLSVYYRASSLLLHGLTPYRDFPLEYPPLALVAFVLPLLAAAGHGMNFPTYIRLFVLENALFSMWMALIVTRLSSPAPHRQALLNRPGALAVFVLLVVIASPLLPWRYDLFPALLTLLGLYAVLRKQPVMAGVWLGFGIAAKLYPVVLLPILAAYYWAGGERRSLVRLLLATGAAVLAGVLPFIGAGTNMLYFLQYHQHRGVEFESVPAGLILLARQLGLTDVQIIFNFGAFHLISPWAAPILRVLPLVFVLAFGLTLARVFHAFRADRQAHGRILPGTLVTGIVAALLAFIVTNKVFSPQYVLWLLPFAPLLPRRPAATLCVVFALTILLFPFSLGPLLDMHTWAILVLNLRNLLVVVALCDLLVSIRGPILPTMRTMSADAARGESR